MCVATATGAGKPNLGATRWERTVRVDLAFAARGLVRWNPDGDELTVPRDPTEAEVAAARRDHVVPDGPSAHPPS